MPWGPNTAATVAWPLSPLKAGVPLPATVVMVWAAAAAVIAAASPSAAAVIHTSRHERCIRTSPHCTKWKRDRGGVALVWSETRHKSTLLCGELLIKSAGMSLTRQQALEMFRSDDLLGFGMAADAVRRRMHHDGVVS